VISAELVRLHGGTLSLDDTRTGARFRVIIPDSGDRADPVRRGDAS
jgi:signal transduction histidine kinase